MRLSMFVIAVSTLFGMGSLAAQDVDGWEVKQVETTTGSAFQGTQGEWFWRSDRVERIGSGDGSKMIASGSIRLLGPHNEVIVAQKAEISASALVLSEDARLLKDGWGMLANRIEVDVTTGRVVLIQLGKKRTE